MNIIKKVNDQKELDLISLFKAMLRRAWLVVILTLGFGAAMTAYTYRFVDPEYIGQIRLYVNNSNSVTDIMSITSSDISASYMLLQSYATVIKSETILEDIINKSGTAYSTEELSEMIQIDAAKNTSILWVGVSCSDPREAALLANCVAESVSDNLAQIIAGSSVRILDYAKVPTRKSGPSYSKAALFGGLIGGFLSVVIVIYLSLRKRKIKTGTDLGQIGYPVLGHIKDGSREEYSQLKTNLMYSLPGRDCKKIVFVSPASDQNTGGVIVSLSGQLSDQGYRVLMMDCNLRESWLTEQTGMAKEAGLTELLSGTAEEEAVIRRYARNVDVIGSGQPSPNPLTLLRSGGARELVESLGQKYDYILIDGPSFGNAEDVIEVCKVSTGIVIPVTMKKVWKQDAESAVEEIGKRSFTILGTVAIEAESKGRKP